MPFRSPPNQDRVLSTVVVNRASESARRTVPLRMGGVLAVTLLAILVAGHSPALAAAGDAAAGRTGKSVWSETPVPQGLDIGTVIETVTNHVAASPDGPDRFEARSGLYRADFTSAGFEIRLREHDGTRGPVDDPGDPRVFRRLTARSVGGSGGAGYETDPALVFGTVTVSVDSTPLPLEPDGWTPEYNRADRILTPDLTERVTARDGHVEWDFVIEKDLSGDGSLTIEADIASPAFGPAWVDLAPLDPMGDGERAGSPPLRPVLRWQAEDGTSLVMSEMVVRDAEGYEIHRALPESTAAGVKLTVPAEVLLAASYPVTIDPLISVEYPVTSPVFGVVPLEGQDFPSMATDGSSYLVVWQDARSDSPFDIWAARVTGSGTVLDPAGFQIASASIQPYPEVAWDGSNYLVVWQDDRAQTGADIYASRISPAGVVIDPTGIAVCTEPMDQVLPSLDFDGSRYLVAWEDRRTGAADIYASFVETTGAVVSPTGFTVSIASSDQGAPAVEWTGTQFLVIWQDRRAGTSLDIYAARVTSAGAVLDGNGFAVSTAAGDQSSPSVDCSAPGNCLAAWRDGRSGMNFDIYGARIDASAGILDPAGIAISTAPNAQRSPAVAWDGTDYMVAWQDFRAPGGGGSIIAARVTTGGTVLDAQGILIASGTNNALRSLSAASNGSNTLIVFVGDRSIANFHIYGSRIDAAGNLLDATEILVSASSNAQVDPAIAWDGVNHLVVWEDYRTGVADLYGARINPSGVILDPAGILITSAVMSQRSPSVDYGVGDYLVVWSDDRSAVDTDIYGARVTASGVVRDPAGILISGEANDQSNPSVTWIDTDWLVVWQDLRTGIDEDIYGARVDPSGTVIDNPSFPITTAIAAQRLPELDFDGTNSLIVWQDSRGGGGSQIFGARVTTTGAVRDPAGIRISTAIGSQLAPTTAWNGDSYLVVWEDARNGAASDIYGTRFASGVPVDPAGFRISVASGTQSRPVVAWDGTSFVVAWQDSRSGTDSDIYAARISEFGAVLPADMLGMPMAVSPIAETGPAISSGPPGRAAIVYQRYSPESLAYTQRSFVGIFSECVRGGSLIAPACGFEPISPPHAIVLDSAGPPPTFEWAPGSQTLFRVEFSKKLTKFKAKAKSSKSFTPGTSYVPTVKVWNKIVKLGKKGRPVYWRALSQDPADKKLRTPSEVFGFTLSP